MKDYNLYYYWLEVPVDATQEEIESAYVKKSAEYTLLVKKYGTPNTLFSDPKWAEFLKRVEGAYEVLSNPVKRQQYHNETYPSCEHAEQRRESLTRCAEVGGISCWPPHYRPSRPGPTPTSYESRSGCALLLCAFIFLAAYSCW
jgi:DnaJ-class molecular chaperone